MNTIRITGLDVSLTGTGISTITIDKPPTLDPRTSISTHTISSTGKKGDDLPKRVRRIRKLRNTILDQIIDSDLVVLEAPAFASKFGSVWDRAGLWHQIVGVLDSSGVPYVDVAPTRVKKFAADKGTADKTAVAAGMTRLWGERADPSNDNEFDALALASLGAIRVAGRQLPIRVLERHREVVAAIVWPTVALNARV